MRNLEQVAEKLKSKISQVSESEVFKDLGEDSLYAPGVGFDEFRKAIKYKKVLLEEFRNISLDQVYDGRELETNFGSVYLITHRERLEINSYIWKDWQQKLLSNLRLIYGIGPKTENKLKEEGYKTIQDLINHPTYKNSARNLIDTIEKRRIKDLHDCLRYWLPASHPTSLCLAGVADTEDLLFFDLESMGLFSRPLVLLGLAKPKKDELLINQYLIRNITEELAGITKTLEQMKKDRILITYNGRRFDCNYLQERLGYYGQNQSIEIPHMDLLFFARRAWKDKLPDCRLKTVEKKILGEERSLNVPSALVPDFYNTYLEEKCIGPLIPIIEHNKQDIISLAHLLANLCKIWK